MPAAAPVHTRRPLAARVGSLGRIVAPRSRPVQASVAGHYDVLDEAYRRVWGEHVHHGLWSTGSETPEEAARALAVRVADAAGLGRGDRVVDVGCGYGATARLIAAERGAAVTGLTLSRAQALGHPPVQGVELLVRDWLANDLPDGAFDAAISIEALSHMPDKPRAFAELGRVVRPGGRVAIVDWLTREQPGSRETRLLLRPICEEGHLPSMHSASEYEALLRDAGLEPTGFEDLSDRVWRTWVVVVRRLLPVLARDRRLAGELLRSPERVFALSLLRIPIAYRTGAMRLGLLTARRPR
jgi:tocopherol O-methyltransferase